MLVNRILVGSVVLCLSAATALGQYQQTDLREFAAKAIANGTVPHTEPTFDVQGSSDGQKLLRYDLGGASIVEPSADNPLDPAVTEQLRVAVLRHYRGTPQQQRFWEPTLQRVEREISQMLTAIQSKDLTEEQLQRRIDSHQENIEQTYQEILERIAAVEGAGEVARKGATYAPQHHLVTLLTRPQGRVYYMASGWWDLYQLAKKRGRQVDEKRWNEVIQGQPLYLGGKYMLSATFGDSGEQRVYGPVAINKSGSVGHRSTLLTVPRLMRSDMRSCQTVTLPHEPPQPWLPR